MLERERPQGRVWRHSAVLPGSVAGASVSTRPLADPRSDTCGGSWSPSGLVCPWAAPRYPECPSQGHSCPLPVGRSCSSDPRWPWQTKGTTMSCAGSPRGPGAGECGFLEHASGMLTAPREFATHLRGGWRYGPDRGGGAWQGPCPQPLTCHLGVAVVWLLIRL